MTTKDSSETDINIVMPKILTFLRHVEKVNGRVLIHCVSGISRSVCVLLMFLIIEHKLHLRDSYEYLKSQRYQKIFYLFNFEISKF